MWAEASKVCQKAGRRACRHPSCGSAWSSFIGGLRPRRLRRGGERADPPDAAHQARREGIRTTPSGTSGTSGTTVPNAHGRHTVTVTHGPDAESTWTSRRSRVEPQAQRVESVMVPSGGSPGGVAGGRNAWRTPGALWSRKAVAVGLRPGWPLVRSPWAARHRGAPRRRGTTHQIWPPADQGMSAMAAPGNTDGQKEDERSEARQVRGDTPRPGAHGDACSIGCCSRSHRQSRARERTCRWAETIPFPRPTAA